jgi:hypothetical protein
MKRTIMMMAMVAIAALALTSCGSMMVDYPYGSESTVPMYSSTVGMLKDLYQTDIKYYNENKPLPDDVKKTQDELWNKIYRELELSHKELLSKVQVKSDFYALEAKYLYLSQSLAFIDSTIRNALDMTVHDEKWSRDRVKEYVRDKLSGGPMGTLKRNYNFEP